MNSFKALFNLRRDIALRIDSGDCFSSVRVQSTRTTLDTVLKLISEQKRGAYLRFGDGDVNLMENKGELIQNADPSLAIEMKEAFGMSGEGVLKSLPLHSPKYGQEQGMMPGLHSSDDEWATNILKRTYPYFIGSPIFSSVALSYQAIQDLRYTVLFLGQLKRHCLVFVGNQKSGQKTLRALFGEAPHVKTPHDGTFGEIARIENEVDRILETGNSSYGVLVLAMGCPGRVLAKRLLQKPHNIFIFDFGSLLDALCGWNTRAWMEICGRGRSYWDKLLDEVEQFPARQSSRSH